MADEYLYGLRDGKLIHISEVPSGLICNCVCPSCYQSLVAHKGKIRIHHFKHRAETSCNNGSETIIHLLAKEIISEIKFLYVPDWELTPSKIPRAYLTRRENGHVHEDILHPTVTIVHFDKVELEKLQEDFKPDIIGYVGSKKLLIEIKVTSGIDSIKFAKIKKSKIPLLEIDLSYLQNTKLVDKDVVEKELYSKAHRRWVYNPKLANKRSKLQEKWYSIRQAFYGNYVDVKVYGNGKIYNCPLKSRNAEPLTLTECYECAYFMREAPDMESPLDWVENYVRCIGHRKAEVDKIMDSL